MSDSGDPKQDKDRELRAEREFYESMPNKPDQSGGGDGELRKQAYNLMQDIVYEYGLGAEYSKHYTETDFGSSFNTEAFCHEKADAILALFDDMCREATCNDVAAGQPNDVHIGYFNKGFEAGVRKCREAMPEKINLTGRGASSAFGDGTRYYHDLGRNEVIDEMSERLSALLSSDGRGGK